MTIEWVPQMDIWDHDTADRVAITVPVNTVGAMGKGLALEAKRRFPSIYPEYRRLCNGGHTFVGGSVVFMQPGMFLITQVPPIILFATKEDWRNSSRIEWIEHGLDILSLPFGDLDSIAIPKLGCGYGGLDWETQVRPLVIEYMKGVDMTVYVHGAGPGGE